MESLYKSNRNQSLDLIKILAMFAVIGLHTFKASYEWRTANIFYESCVVAIPLFFMVSGCLLLGRSNIGINYVLRKIWGIVKFVFILAIVLWLVKSFRTLQTSPYVLGKIFGGALIQHGSLWMCWYLGTMIIVYALLPILSRIFLEKKKWFWTLMILFFLVEYLIFIENLEKEGGPLEMGVIQTFRLWNWLFYFMLGGALSKFTINLKKKGMLLVIIAGMLLLNVCFQESLKSSLGSPYCEYFYSSLIVMLLSSLIFVYIININIGNGFSKVISLLSSLFLPVYILHPFVIKGIEMTNLELATSPYFLFVSVSMITVVLAYFLMLIPPLRYLFRI